MSSFKLVLLGFLRHTIGALGAFLVARGYLASEAQASWVATAVQEAFGGLMMLGAYVWSAADKKQVISWIRQALHLRAPQEVSPDPEQAHTDEGVTSKQISPLLAGGAK